LTVSEALDFHIEHFSSPKFLVLEFRGGGRGQKTRQKGTQSGENEFGNPFLAFQIIFAEHQILY